MDKEILKGSIDILLLSIIGRQDTYGYDIIQQLKALSNGEYLMSQGTLYPALKRLEKKGLLRSYWVENEETGRRKFYSLTNEGKAELQEKLRSWNQINLLIQACRKVEFA
ncbi:MULTISPECIES: PadR family transcriptional regulator [Bacillales]|jgi:DNA-binding PadR family transcriptional regulator|uniref:PadR family transcriptional regulator n=1 Tax=Brevibacillus TaxID=55080 RepID=UPI001490CC5B|nr:MULTISPECIES: PadR family transcriptional regulator [Bacillales]MBR8658027.1 PadR family transcriptional regulator [Brevibacillus sp. NL20B1]MDT3416781.1 DNA-binding PadR family transcriptional regulator [Brevibacillus aydinogluensis]NNV01629.1 PadR family transcriptional regulator [Brevibacillus sp. MCWH]UFJ61279.1 PadR family transcriptional regulator [Anoxybacillus sediminis]